MKKISFLFLAIILTFSLISAGNYGSGNYGSGNYAGTTTPSTPTGISGGGGGGGATTPKLECTQNSDCQKNQYCSENKCHKAECFENSECNLEKSEVCLEYKCVKLFDAEIKDFESPARLGDFFEFTYLIKGMANISGDVIINFWIENEKEKITTGSDTIYLGSFEEKIKTTKLFLPSTAKSGIYEFYVEVSFENYKAKAHRTIEIQVDEEKGIAIITKKISWEEYLPYFLAILIATLAIIILIITIKRIKKKKEALPNKTQEKTFLQKIQEDKTEENWTEYKQRSINQNLPEITFTPYTSRINKIKENQEELEKKEKRKTYKQKKKKRVIQKKKHPLKKKIMRRISQKKVIPRSYRKEEKEVKEMIKEYKKAVKDAEK